MTSAAAAAPGTAGAAWRRISARPSTDSPFFVCPAHSSRFRCAAIEDPTEGLQQHRGPVAAGVITKGPEQEVSPAFEGSGVDGGYSPQNLRSAYGINSTAGTGQTVAVVDAYDDPNAQADLGVYRSEYGLSSCTEANGCFRKVNETGGTSYPVANAEWAREISLDLDMVSATCSGCHLLLVEAREATPQDIAAAENEAVVLGATEISDSFYSEEAANSQYASAYHHPGIPITVAAGDGGYGPTTPASSRDVIAVGATTLEKEGGSHHGRSEAVWANTGGGCSAEPKPSWQTDSQCSFRTENDVAAVGDPNTPVSVYDSYQPTGSSWRLLGGTSAAAPIVAGMMALSSAFTRSFDGAQALYLAEGSGAYAFYEDIPGSTGSCGGSYLCVAQPGDAYDGPRGLGSPRGVPSLPAPTLATQAPTALTTSEATLHATVDPDYGELSACEFEYGTTTSYGASVGCSTVPAPGTSPVAVSGALAELAAGTAYHYRVVVTYRDGENASEDATFSTPESPVTLTPAAPSSIAQTYATLNATVDPDGASITVCRFEYGPTSSYGASAACVPTPSGAGHAPIAVAATIGGLSAGTDYHYRLAVQSAEGVLAHDGDSTLRTLPAPPSASTGPVASLTATSATLTATVDPLGNPSSSCVFEFTGASGPVPCSPSPGSDSGSVSVSAPVSDLVPSTTYSYRVVASNEGGSTYGAIESFSTPEELPGHISPPGPDPEPDVRLTSVKLVLAANGAVPIKLTCPTGESTCSGTVQLRTLTAVTVGRAGHPSHRSMLTLATAKFSFAGGGRLVIQLHLSRAARILLSHLRSLRVRATIVAHDTLGSAHTTQQIVTIASHRR